MGLESSSPLPATEFSVECADGWGNAVETRPAVDTVALPGSAWIARPDPAGGWIMAVMPSYDRGWNEWLEQQGVDLQALPDGHILLRLGQDGSLAWVAADYSARGVDFVGDALWVWGTNEATSERSLLSVDPVTGAVIAVRPWDLGPSFNRLASARDPAGGAWISAISYRDDALVDQSLYRATTLDTIELVATRTTEDPKQSPSGGLEPLIDGAVAWSLGVDGFEVIEPDGSVRWARSEGFAGASDIDTTLIVSRVPTGFGAGLSVRLEKVALADGASLWTREHQRFVVTESERCGPDDCGLLDLVYPTLRADGGYLLTGRHAYPNSACPRQPLIMAVSATGEAEWAHRVETCGTFSSVAARTAATIEVRGLTWDQSKPGWLGAWTRTFEL